jgi:hypothetical protein
LFSSTSFNNIFPGGELHSLISTFYISLSPSTYGLTDNFSLASVGFPKGATRRSSAPPSVLNLVTLASFIDAYPHTLFAISPTSRCILHIAAITGL